MTQSKPILLFNNECAVCRRIAAWIARSAHKSPDGPTIVLHPIGDDPDILHNFHPDLDIWDAYATVHVLMPDGSMKLGGEAVAEVLRKLPNTRWFAWIFGLTLFGLRPFQMMLNLAYTILADLRPLLGCESCGVAPRWVRPVELAWRNAKAVFTGNRRARTPHFSRHRGSPHRPLTVAPEGVSGQRPLQ